jgi:hypothetical protein
LRQHNSTETKDVVQVFTLNRIGIHVRKNADMEDTQLNLHSRTKGIFHHRNPNRWSGVTRNWQPIESVALNPEKEIPLAA